MAKYKMQQRLFGLIIDGSSSQKITPVTSKETSIALEILVEVSKRNDLLKILAEFLF
jgi:hypothetical protein